MTRSLALLIALAATFAALAPAASEKSCGRGEIPWKLVGRPGCVRVPASAAAAVGKRSGVDDSGFARKIENGCVHDRQEAWVVGRGREFPRRPVQQVVEAPDQAGGKA